MRKMATEPYTAELQGEERFTAEQNRGAVLTLWMGIGSILCLLLSCFLGSLRSIGSRYAVQIGIMAFLLIASVLLYLFPSKRDERWYLVCSLLNHSGIGLAAVVLLNVLELSLPIKSLILSGFPPAAVLFGVVMFYISADGEKRKQYLYYGLAGLGLLCAVSVGMYFKEETAFWICTAICSLLGCTSLAALVWSSIDPERKSIYQGLAVASFSVYLLVLAAALAALAVAVLGSGSSSSSNRKSKSSSKSSSGSSSSSGSGLLSSLFHGSGTRSVSPVYRTRRSWFPMYLWYYTPRTRFASIDRMEDLGYAEKEALRTSYRNRRRIALIVIAVIVAVVIGLAIYFGRV